MIMAPSAAAKSRTLPEADDRESGRWASSTKISACHHVAEISQPGINRWASAVLVIRQTRRRALRRDDNTSMTYMKAFAGIAENHRRFLTPTEQEAANSLSPRALAARSRAACQPYVARHQA